MEDKLKKLALYAEAMAAYPDKSGRRREIMERDYEVAGIKIPIVAAELDQRKLVFVGIKGIVAGETVLNERLSETNFKRAARAVAQGFLEKGYEGIEWIQYDEVALILDDEGVAEQVDHRKAKYLLCV